MRKQYHFWPGEQAWNAWDVDRLIALSVDLPVIEVPLDPIGELDSPYGALPGPSIRRSGNFSCTCDGSGRSTRPPG